MKAPRKKYMTRSSPKFALCRKRREVGGRGVSDQKARKRYVEKIRKRVARIEKPDD